MLTIKQTGLDIIDTAKAVTNYSETSHARCDANPELSTAIMPSPTTKPEAPLFCGGHRGQKGRVSAQRLALLMQRETANKTNTPLSALRAHNQEAPGLLLGVTNKCPVCSVRETKMRVLGWHCHASSATCICNGACHSQQPAVHRPLPKAVNSRSGGNPPFCGGAGVAPDCATQSKATGCVNGQRHQCIPGSSLLAWHYGLGLAQQNSPAQHSASTTICRAPKPAVNKGKCQRTVVDTRIESLAWCMASVCWFEEIGSRSFVSLLLMLTLVNATSKKF